jgi:hypothetical protein
MKLPAQLRLALGLCLCMLERTSGKRGDLWTIVRLKAEERMKRGVCLDGSAPGTRLRYVHTIYMVAVVVSELPDLARFLNLSACVAYDCWNIAYYWREGWGSGADKFLTHYEGKLMCMDVPESGGRWYQGSTETPSSSVFL